MTRRLKFLLHTPRKKRTLAKIENLPLCAEDDVLIPLLVDVADECLSYLYAKEMYEGVFILPRPQPYSKSNFGDIKKSCRAALASLAYIMHKKPACSACIKNLALINREKYPPRG